MQSVQPVEQPLRELLRGDEFVEPPLAGHHDADTGLGRAARVDGCHTLRVFWHVVLPAVRPIAAVLGLLTFMNTWNDFFWPLIVLTPQNPTVQVAVSALQSGYVQDYALVFAGTFISIIPLLVIFLVLGRQVIGGIMKGAVKG